MASPTQFVDVRHLAMKVLHHPLVAYFTVKVKGRRHPSRLQPIPDLTYSLLRIATLCSPTHPNIMR